MTMQYSKSGLQLTERFEGCRLVAYQDQGGVWTVGYGHTGPDVYPGMVITQEQAQALLEQDIQRAVDTVNRLVSVPITQGEFDALVDFVFNLGAGAFMASTLLRDVEAQDWAAAAAQFSRWDHCGGQVVAGLLTRRLAERQEFLS
jgi:lysozyme